MNRIIIIGLIILTIILGVFVSNFNQQNTNLKIYINELEYKIEQKIEQIDNLVLLKIKLENKVSELEDQLITVQHFDNQNRVSYGYSKKNTNFTGDLIESQIYGEFTGWEGETIFKMMDGSIWQQVSYDYIYHYAYMPSIIIYTKSGSYYMKVQGINDEIQVRRIK